MTVRLSPTEFDLTCERIAKINARAAKRGFTGRFTVTGTEITVTNGFNPPKVPYLPANATWVEVDTEISGDAPSYGGWEFLAALDALPTTDGTPAWIVRCAPGVEDTDVDRSTLIVGHCDHCGTAKANRRYTYLVRNIETGEYKQVGSTCIKDFTGWQGRPVFLSLSDVSDDAFDGFGGGTPAFTPLYLVTVAAATVATYGWVPASRMDGNSTRGKMDDYLFGTSNAAADLRTAVDANMVTTDTAQTMIDTVIEDFTADTGYEANMVSALRAQYVTPAQMGLVASAVAAYERIVGKRAARDAKRQSDAAKPDAQYLGAVGDKVQFTGVVVLAMTVDGYSYNSTQRLIVVEGGSALAKMYTTAAWAYDVASGDTVTLTATVKAHVLYGDREQTVVTRAKRVTV